VAHSATSGPVPVRPAGTDDPSIGSLVQSAMADMSTLVRSEIELAKTEITTSAKKAGISIALFVVAGVLLAFAGIYFFVAAAEGIAEGLPRWLSYLIVAVGLAAIAGMAALVGLRMMKKLDKPERTMESLRELPEVMHREAPGERRRDLPVVANGQVSLRDPDSYIV
jgi:membrane protein implicated in regulation of membrane protease activity